MNKLTVRDLAPEQLRGGRVVIPVEGRELVEDGVASLQARVAEHLVTGDHVVGRAVSAAAAPEAGTPLTGAAD